MFVPEIWRKLVDRLNRLMINLIKVEILKKRFVFQALKENRVK